MAYQLQLTACSCQKGNEQRRPKQVSIPNGKRGTGRYYRDVVLKKLKIYYQKQHAVDGFQHVCLFHDNAPAHSSVIVNQFRKSEKVTVLSHTTYILTRS